MKEKNIFLDVGINSSGFHFNAIQENNLDGNKTLREVKEIILLK